MTRKIQSFAFILINLQYNDRNLVGIALAWGKGFILLV
jgi:hypothetical protein